VFLRIFIVERFDGVYRESGDTTMVDIQTFLKAFLNMSLTSSSFIDNLFVS